MKNNDFEKDIEQSLDKISDIDVKKPDFMYFTALVKKEKEQIRRRQNLQFGVFIILSFFIVGFILLSLFNNIVIFAIMQTLPTLVFVLIYVTLYTRKKRATR